MARLKKKKGGSVHWLDQISNAIEKTIVSMKLEDDTPKEPWGARAWDSLEYSLLMRQGIRFEEKSRAFQLGYCVAFFEKLHDETLRGFKLAGPHITEKSEEAWSRLTKGEMGTLGECMAEFQRSLTPFHAIYVKAQKIAAKAPASDAIDYYEGLNLLLKTPLFNQKALPVGSERATMHFLLGMMDISAQILNIPRYVIDPEKFHNLLTMASGSNVGGVARTQKYLTDMKAPRRPRGRPKKSS